MKKIIRRTLTATLLPASLVIAGCGGDDPPACDRNQAVYDIMQSWYYWYAEMPAANPDDYPTPEDLLDVLTLPEQNLGKHYSYLTTDEEEAAFLSNAAYVGFGISLGEDQDGRIFLKESFEGGPAHAAGMRRGDEIISIDGVAVSSMSAEQFNAALGPDEAGYTVSFGVRHPDTTTDAYAVAKAEVEAPVVAHVQTDLPNGVDGDTTYIFFRSFVNPAFDELDAAFAAMKAAGDTQLVLDLRYNGGGLISVAEHLGGLIAGVDHGGTVAGVDDGELIAEIAFNDKHTVENTPFYIDTLANSVDVTDIVVITTPATASASEMVINGLAPFAGTIHVATVGSTTYGKPVGQSRFDFCTDDILRAVAFKVVNADGEGEYFNGIAPTCAAIDDVLDPLGDPAEASLQSALYYLDNGMSCDASASTKAMRVHAKRQAVQPLGDPLVRDGWDVLTGGVR